MQFAQLKKNEKRKSYLTMFLDEKMQKNLQKTHFGNIGASNLKFYSISLKLGSQMHKEF
jgi:hypothetical protein